MAGAAEKSGPGAAQVDSKGAEIRGAEVLVIRGAAE